MKPLLSVVGRRSHTISAERWSAVGSLYFGTRTDEWRRQLGSCRLVERGGSRAHGTSRRRTAQRVRRTRVAGGGGVGGGGGGWGVEEGRLPATNDDPSTYRSGSRR